MAAALQPDGDVGEYVSLARRKKNAINIRRIRPPGSGLTLQPPGTAEKIRSSYFRRYLTARSTMLASSSRFQRAESRTMW